jgi:hypothetical protein
MIAAKSIPAKTVFHVRTAAMTAAGFASFNESAPPKGFRIKNEHRPLISMIT